MSRESGGERRRYLRANEWRKAESSQEHSDEPHRSLLESAVSGTLDKPATSAAACLLAVYVIGPTFTRSTRQEWKRPIHAGPQQVGRA